MWQIIIQIETHVKYEISAHVKGQNTTDKVLNDYVGRRDAKLCLDVNAGSCTETHFLLGSLCFNSDYVYKESSEWSQYGIW